MIVRILMGCFILIHGVIHLLGFVKEWHLAPVEQLSGRTLCLLSGNLAKTVGLFWLLCCLLFLIVAVLTLLNKDWWWILAVPVILGSQLLIILYWHDARYGTIANVIILVAAVLTWGTWSFNRMVANELRSFQTPTVPESIIVNQEMISHLPEAVQKWLERSQIIGKELIHTVHLKQKGEMKTKPDGSWMPFTAKQYFSVEPPAFIWIADVKAAPFVSISGRDKYQNGHGHMLIKLLDLIPVAEAQGRETDQGTLLRYLAETVWFPTAALSSYITWEAAESGSVRATMNYGGITAAGLFSFSEEGDVISFEAQRYYDRKEGPTLETWLIGIDQDSFRTMDGIRIPLKSTVTWRLKTGDFTWFKLEISDVVYNK